MTPNRYIYIYGFELTKLIVLLIFRILRHHDIITILYWTYEFRLEIKVSNLVRLEFQLIMRYCNVTEKELAIFRPSA